LVLLEYFKSKLIFVKFNIDGLLELPLASIFWGDNEFIGGSVTFVYLLER